MKVLLDGGVLEHISGIRFMIKYGTLVFRASHIPGVMVKDVHKAKSELFINTNTFKVYKGKID